MDTSPTVMRSCLFVCVCVWGAGCVPAAVPDAWALATRPNKHRVFSLFL